MAETFPGPVLALSGARLQALAGLLGELIDAAYTGRGKITPHALLAFAVQVETAAAAPLPCPVVIVAAVEGRVLRRQVGEAVRGARAVGSVQEALSEFAGELCRVFPDPTPEPRRFRAPAPVPVSGEPVITVTAAAGGAGCSTGYVRRMCRRGELETMPRDCENAPYLVLLDSFELWLSAREHRKRDAEAA